MSALFKNLFKKKLKTKKVRVIFFIVMKVLSHKGTFFYSVR